MNIWDYFTFFSAASILRLSSSLFALLAESATLLASDARVLMLAILPVSSSDPGGGPYGTKHKVGIPTDRGT